MSALGIRAIRIARLTAVLALCACSQLGPLRTWLEDPGPATEEYGPAEVGLREALDAEEPPAAEPPEAVTSALLPPLPGRELEAGEAEPRFDVSVSRSPADEFFRGLVEGTSYNVVVHPDVQGEISLRLRSVTIPEVLETVQQIYGFTYTRTAGVFHVMPARLQSRVFELDYLNVQRTGHSQTRVSSGQVSEQAASSDGGDEGNGSESEAVSGSMIFTNSETDLWAEITRTILQIVGSDAGRSVVTSPNSGVVVVRAMPGELRDVEEYLTTVEENLQRQVVLEAKIVEVTLSDGFRAGINWSRLGQLGAENTIQTTQTGGGASLPLPPGASEIAGNVGDLLPGASALPNTSETSTFGGVFALAIEGENFEGLLELLETQGDTQVLSSPRVSTLNNQKAVIKVGNDEFFVTDVSTTTVTGASTTTNPEVTLTPFFSGIALDVTPQIGADRWVTLHIHPSVSEVEDQQKLITIGESELNLPLAFSTIRETDSIVRARSGQVVVIGGLMQDNLTDQRASIPWFARIPLLGSLFEQNLEGALKKELVILLRPVVIGPGSWKKTIAESVDRVESMKQRQRRGGRP
jgi:MSHA biogenesis protein MshL